MRFWKMMQDDVSMDRSRIAGEKERHLRPGGDKSWLQTAAWQER